MGGGSTRSVDMLIKKAQKVSGSKEPMSMSLRVTTSGENLADGGSRETRKCGYGMSRRCLRRCLATVEEGCHEEARKKRGREEEEDSKESIIRNDIAQEVVAGIKEKAGAHEDAKPTAQRTVGQSVKQNWANG